MHCRGTRIRTCCGCHPTARVKASRAMNDSRRHVVVAGAGVAGLETALALQALAPEHVSVELIAPEDEFVYRPLAVAEPFHVGEVRRFPLARLVEAAGAELRNGVLAGVRPDEKLAVLADGKTVEYDVVVLALGARPLAAVPGALTFRGLPEDSEELARLLERVTTRDLRRLVFAVPDGLDLAVAALRARHADGRVPLRAPDARRAHDRHSRGAAARTVRDGGERGDGTSARDTRDRPPRRRRSPLRSKTARSSSRTAAQSPRTLSSHCRSWRGHPSTGSPRTNAASSAPTSTAASPSSPTCTRQAISHSPRSSRAASQPRKPTPSPRRSPPMQGRRCSRARAGRSCADCSSPGSCRGSCVTRKRAPSLVDTQPLWWPPGKIVGRYLSPFLAEHLGLAATSETAPGDALPVEVAVDRPAWTPV